MRPLRQPRLAHAGDRPPKLVVGLLPGESAPTVMRLNEPLRAYLEKRLGLPVELVVGANYAATGEALRFGRLDIAYLGPVTYLLRARSAKLEPFARPSHAVVGPTFQAVIIVPADSPAEDARRPQGRRDRIRRSGLDLRHLGAALSAARGRADFRPRLHAAGARRARRGGAGGRQQEGRGRRAVDADLQPSAQGGQDRLKAVRLLAESPPIPEYMWTFREGIDPAFKEEIRKAFTRSTIRRR